MIKQILDDLVASVNEAQTAIFLDGDGEAISQSGDNDFDMQLIGARNEIELDHIKEICENLSLGKVHAVVAPVSPPTRPAGDASGGQGPALAPAGPLNTSRSDRPAAERHWWHGAR